MAPPLSWRTGNRARGGAAARLGGWGDRAGGLGSLAEGGGGAGGCGRHPLLINGYYLVVLNHGVAVDEQELERRAGGEGGSGPGGGHVGMGPAVPPPPHDVSPPARLQRADLVRAPHPPCPAHGGQLPSTP